MKKKLITQLKISIILLILLSLYRWKLDLSFVFLWLGGLTGSLILYSDYLFQALLIHPELSVSQDAKKLFAEKKYQEAVFLIYKRKEEIQKFTFHTIFFQIIFTFFSFFVISSTVSHFGQGLVLCALLHLLYEQVLDLRKTGRLSDYWFAKINVYLPVERQKLYVGGMVIILLILISFIRR